MVTVSNSPREATLLELEAGKSFALGVFMQDANQNPVDLTGCTFTMTIAKVDKGGNPTVVATNVASIPVGTDGYARFDLQATDLALAATEYVMSVILLSAGYSLTVLKGTVKILPSVAPTGPTYVLANAPQSLIARLQAQSSVHVDLVSAYPPNIVRVPSGGTTGQVLVKASSTSFDFTWGTLVGGLSGAGQTIGKSPVTDGAGGWAWADIATQLELNAAITSLQGYADTKKAEAIAAAATDATTKANAAQAAAATDATTKANAAQAAAIAAAAIDASAKRDVAKAYADSQDILARESYTGTVTGITSAGIQVLLSTGTTVTVAWNAQKTYVPALAEVVLVDWSQTNNTWTFVGPRKSLSYIQTIPPYGSGYKDYEGYMSQFEWNTVPAGPWGGVHATRTPSGIVKVTGMVSRTSGNFTLNDIVATLPAAFAPDYVCYFAAYNAGGQYVRLQVDTDGTIRIGSTNATSGQWLELGSIEYIVGATWTNATLLNSCTAVTAAIGGLTRVGTMPVPGYTMDPYGFVWFRGAVAKASGTADGTIMFTMPAGYGPGTRQHHQITSSMGSVNAWGEVGSAPGTTDKIFKAGGLTAAPSGVTLDGTRWASSSVAASVGQYAIDGMSSYTGAAQWSPLLYITPEGFCYMTGLNAGAASGTAKIGTTTALARPRTRTMITSDNSNNPSVLITNPNGNVAIFVATTSSWQSIDIAWMADPMKAEDYTYWT